MNTSSKKILVPIDFSDVTESVIDEAKEIAQGRNMEVVLLHVETNPDDYIQFSVRAPGLDAALKQHTDYAKEELNHYKNMLAEAGVQAEIKFQMGPIHTTIMQEIEEQDPAMIVVGSHGHGSLYHVLMGSVCESVFKKAHCPVIVVPSAVTAGI